MAEKKGSRESSASWKVGQWLTSTDEAECQRLGRIRTAREVWQSELCETTETEKGLAFRS